MHTAQTATDAAADADAATELDSHPGIPYTLVDVVGDVRKEILAADEDDMREQAKAWAKEGDWDLSGGTIWVDVRVLDADGDRVETVTAAIHPPEPRCTGGEHDWQSPHEIVGGIEENPGVWGHGGGVIIHECCMRCGAHMVTDTWAQRPDTGEQGLESVRYDGPGHYTLPQEDAA